MLVLFDLWDINRRQVDQRGEILGEQFSRIWIWPRHLAELQDHIEGLTLGIPDVRIEELPMRLQRHTIGVPSRWMRLLHMIAQAVTCYHEHH